MVEAQEMDPPHTVADTEISVIDCDDNNSSDMLGRAMNDNCNIILPGLYELSVYRDTQIEQYHTVKQTDRERLTRNREDKVHKSDELVSYLEEFLTMILEFQCKWEGHIGWISIANGWIELTPEKTQTVHKTLYRAGWIARETENIEI